MSEVTTSWRLKFDDLISSAVRQVGRVVSGATDQVEEMGNTMQLTGAKAVKALENETKHRKEVETAIKEEEKALVKLEKQQKEQTGKEWQETEHKIKEAKKVLEQYNEELEVAKKDVEELTVEVERFNNQQSRIGFVATAWNQATELVDKFADSLDFANEYNDIENNIQRMTGAAGEMLDDATSKAYRISKVYGDAGDEIARSANAASKSFGVSFDYALSVLEQGYQKGGNLNQDMLEQIREYSSVLQPLGYTLDEIMAKVANANMGGVFNDKMLDALKEGGISLREMNTSTQQALAGIGLLPKDLKDKTVKESYDIIAAAMDRAGVTVAEKQQVISNIFRGAGEDAGVNLIEGLRSGSNDLGSLPAVEQAGTQLKGLIADVQSWLSQTMGGTVVAVQQLSPVFMGVASGISIFQELSKVTWLQTAATKVAAVTQGVFNAVMMANPIGLVVAAVGLLVAGIVLLRNKFAWCNAIVEVAKGTWKEWGTVIIDVVLFPLKLVVAQLEGIWKLLHGDYKGAMKSFASPVTDIINDTSAAVEKSKKVALKANVDFENTKNKKGQVSPSITNPDSYKSQVLDGSIAPGGSSSSGRSKSGNASDNGLSTGAGGSKSLAMTINITNNFSGKINSKLDIRELADEVAGVLTDRIEDQVLAL